MNSKTIKILLPAAAIVLGGMVIWAMYIAAGRDTTQRNQNDASTLAQVQQIDADNTADASDIQNTSKPDDTSNESIDPDDINTDSVEEPIDSIPPANTIDDSSTTIDESVGLINETTTDLADDIQNAINPADSDNTIAKYHFQTQGALADLQFTPIGQFEDTNDISGIQLTLTPYGGGISQITLHDHYKTLDYVTENRYELFDGIPQSRPAFGLVKLAIDGQAGQHALNATATGWDSGKAQFTQSVWKEIAPGKLEAVVLDTSNTPAFRILRQFIIGPEHGQIRIEQAVTNLTDATHDISIQQWGPCDLPYIKGGYGDFRRIRFGYLSPQDMNSVLSADGDLILRRGSAIKDKIKNNTQLMWPNDASIENGLTSSWISTTNRYFCLAVYSGAYDHNLTNSPKELSSVEAVTLWVDAPGVKTIGNLDTSIAEQSYISLRLHSPQWTVRPRSVRRFDLGLYAGPLDRPLLTSTEPYRSFNLKELVFYQLSCSLCTFQWLAQFLLWFLRFIHGDVLGFGTGDWAISIIILVLCVRTVLHPLTKKGQVSMQRFSKKMQALQPELKKLQAKCKDDKKKLQREQMRMYKEHNVNPVGCLGTLPMFLQMPIWVALYAMLYFAIELRQEPAFYGVFQIFNGWDFLADLAAPDRFINFGGPILANVPVLQSIPIVNGITSINILPLLMGAIFYFQQKYMTPHNPNMTPEQASQQKMMRIMMPVIFPIFLYIAPSGLTLYIITSSSIGIFESRYIRSHVTSLDLADGNGAKKGIFGKFISSRMNLAKQAVEQKQNPQARKHVSSKSKKKSNKKKR